MSSEKRSRTNVRWIALQILLNLEDEHSNSALLLQEAYPGIADSRDRAMVTDLVLGTLRWRERLRYLMEAFSKRLITQIDPEVALILQLGIYQLLFTRIAPHAVLDETVELCKRAGFSSAAAFVNGILRAVQSRLSSLPEPSESDLAYALSVRWSHPLWLIRRWLRRFGNENAIALMQTNNQPPPLYIRVNELVIDSGGLVSHLQEEGIQLKPTKFPKLFVATSGAPQLTRSFTDGEFYIQDASSEVLGEVAGVQERKQVLDAAAAPGGKTFQLANRMQDRGLILAMDSDWKRIRMWVRNIERMKIRCAHPVVADASRLPFQRKFDLVLVDAPCSSLGVIRRHPEIKWWRKQDDLATLQSKQLQILNACAKYVGDSGELIYSVCSFEPEETEEVVKKFLGSHTELETVKINKGDNTNIYLYPHTDDTDGFFIAKFKRVRNHKVTKVQRITNG